MTDERMKIVQPILDTIENDDIKKFAIALLEDLPEYIWHVPASSTGKYHPSYSLGEGGLMRHQMAVVRFLNFFFELEQYNSKLSSREMDLMRVAGLVHDGMKSGTQEQFSTSKYTKFEHPMLMAIKIREEFTEYLPLNELEFVSDVISKHMGQWNTDKKSSITLPKPSDKFSRMLHVADYLASRKCLTMDFDNYVPENNKVEWDKNYVLSFGKYSGQKLIDIYKAHPDYVEWMEQNISKRDVLNMIKAMKKSLQKEDK